MNPLDRRVFLKHLLVSAAGASQASGLAWRESAHAEVEAAAPFVTLDSGEQQLRLSLPGVPFSFQNYLHVNGAWKPASLPSSLISGPSFSMVPADIRREGTRVLLQGTGDAPGVDRNRVRYKWNAEISARTANGSDAWFRFETTLHLTEPMRLQTDSNVEPQLITWLSSNSALMEGQSGSWRRVMLGQPTQNSLGTYGNDLPALYLLDQNQGVETMMYFDVGDMGWMSTENLPRFLVYRCSSLSRIGRDRNEQLGVGLIASQATGDLLPAGEIRFSHWLLQRATTGFYTEQQAVTRWMQSLLPLFEEKLTWPSCATNWREYAEGTVRDLQQSGTANITVDGHIGLRAYIKASSQVWKESADNFELMTMTDILWPALLYLRLHPDPAFESECKQLLESLPGFYHEDTESLSNDFKRGADERADSWYPFENGLIKYPMIGSFSGSNKITQHFLRAFKTAQRMAHRYNYLFPIYYRVSSLDAEGAGTNYAVGGLYAWSSILAHKLTSEGEYLEEATRAIRVLCTVPAERLFHEPQELAYAALAAAELGMTDEAHYLLSEELRMFYWYSDPSQLSHDIRGMVQAAASILYPAFKENVEAILPWTGVMKRGIVFDGLLRFMDQQRRNNFYFFENCLGGPRGAASKFIPYENLSTLELGGQTGSVGKEIYGAGETLWMYLMFEALGHVSDRELMLVNLDLLDCSSDKVFPPRKLTFILFNPSVDVRTATISLPFLSTKGFRLSENGEPVAATVHVPSGGHRRLVAEYG